MNIREGYEAEPRVASTDLAIDEDEGDDHETKATKAAFPFA
jgi:hypothetical protein